MIEQICRELNNWFDVDRIFGEFEIKDGFITYADGSALPLQDGQYFRICDSVFNDGVYRFDIHTSFLNINERFDGVIWAMAVPKAVIDLATEVEDWLAKYGGIDSPAMSPYQSESFGGYSYSKGYASVSGKSSSIVSWQTAFHDKLKPYKKLNVGGR